MAVAQYEAEVGERSIIIVGGGTAGWLTAAYLAQAFGTAASITLLESPEIGSVGVGEGSFPTIRETLRFLDIPEAAFVGATDATFKQGIRFNGWLHEGEPALKAHSYVHPFEPPFPINGTVAGWLKLPPEARTPFAEAVTIQNRVASEGRAPKQPSDGEFEGPLSYAFHFDAVKLAAVLADRARALGVAHRSTRLTGVAVDSRGWIESLETTDGTARADLYVDCTGFAASLIGGALASPFHSVADQLFTDRALTCRLPYRNADEPIESTTLATAHEAGWVWDIGLAGARGIGCVYSSRHMDDARADEILAAYLGDRAGEVIPRGLGFTSGWRERQWLGNCVAVGLAAGFLEPLESTGLVLIEVAAAMIAELLPLSGEVDAPSARFDEVMTARFAGIVDFLKLHYCLSRRPEPFWRDNADPTTISPRLTRLLDQWRSRPPSRFDFPVDTETFAAFNYQYILYGMGFRTEPPGGAPADDRLFERIRAYGESAAKELPPHRLLVDRLAHLSRGRTGS